MPNICGKSLPVCYSIFTISFFLTNKIPVLLNTLQPTFPSLQIRPDNVDNEMEEEVIV